MGVAETEKALRVEVLRVCRAYCLQVWNEALNLVGVEASFTLRRVEYVYYPSAICALDPPSSFGPKADIVSKKADNDKASLPKSFPLPTALLRKLNKLRPLRKEKTQPRKWFLKLLSLQLCLRTLLRIKKLLRALRLF